MQERHYEVVSTEDVVRVEDRIIRLQAIMRGYIIHQQYSIKPIVGKFDDSVKIDNLLTNELVN